MSGASSVEGTRSCPLRWVQFAEPHEIERRGGKMHLLRDLPATDVSTSGHPSHALHPAETLFDFLAAPLGQSVFVRLLPFLHSLPRVRIGTPPF